MSQNGHKPGTNRRWCRGQTKRGTACQRHPLADSDYCASHEATRQQERADNTADWKAEFLKSLGENLTVSAACRDAGVDRATVYRARQQDEVFALAWHDLVEDVVDRVERRAVLEALGGDMRAIELILRAKRPEVYDRARQVKHSGSMSHLHQNDPLGGVNPADLPPDTQREIAAALARARPQLLEGSGEDVTP